MKGYLICATRENIYRIFGPATSKAFQKESVIDYIGELPSTNLNIANILSYNPKCFLNKKQAFQCAEEAFGNNMWYDDIRYWIEEVEI